MARLPLSFYERDAATVARALLGQILARRVGTTVLRARIVETEAYMGPHDLAAHSARGHTARTSVMFGPAGRAYVYLVYGMHEMMNVVAGACPDPAAPASWRRRGQAVLLRAAEPLGWTARLDGPGKLARALGIDRSLYGHDLRRAPLWLEQGDAPRKIGRSARIGVEYAGAWADKPLRFLDAHSAPLSRTRARGVPSARRPQPGQRRFQAPTS
ncbi:MAG: DNA-3-methyladenine glycosylase [Thermoplasmatota archaeon]